MSSQICVLNLLKYSGILHWYIQSGRILVDFREVHDMAANYVKLFKLLLDRKMLKRDLGKLAGISGSTLSKLYRGESVNTEILVKICNALRCDFSDIMQMEFDDDA